MTAVRILLLGPPGAGKGTQASRLADEFDVEHITTGDALRANKDLETEYGTPREYMERGELLPDPVVNEIVETAISNSDGFVLDGYPRTISQAEYLDGITELDIVITLRVPRDELITRLTGRRVCSECDTNYHLEYDPPTTEGICDHCGGDLIQRDDDTEETVRDRLEVYREQTRPVREYYEERGVVHEVDGNRNPDAVWESIQELIMSHHGTQ